MDAPRPYSLLAELTYACPLKCPYCSNPLELKRYRDELDTATWCRVLAEAAALGVVQVHFSGGEPLVRRDLVEIIAAARKQNLYTNLSTSSLGADEARLAELRDAGLDTIQVSLQDTRAAENDFIAGIQSFEQKCRTVEAARRLGLPLTLNVVLHRLNLDRIEEVLELAARWDVERVELAHVQYTGWGFRNRDALLPTREQLARAEAAVAAARARFGNRPEILHVLPDNFQKYPKACLSGWGRVFMTVAPDGAVLPCQTAREIPGLQFPNVRDLPLDEIWFHGEVFEKFRGTEWMSEPCRSCDRREIDYGGCRCQAFLVTGDAANTDPVCHLSPLHHLVLREVPADPPPLVFRRF